MSKSRGRGRVGSLSVVLALVAGLLLATSASSHAAARFSLRNAPIPASCGHEATRLDGYSKDFGASTEGASQGSAALDHAQARYGRLKGRKGRVAAVTLSCNAGGVGWPELVLVYAPGPKLIGTIDLGKIAAAQEHEEVTSLELAPGKVALRWTAYEGAGFAVSTHRGTISWKKGHLKLRHAGPMTVDYEVGYDPDAMSYDWWFWGKVQESGDARLWISPAPKKFQRFVERRWALLEAANPSCPSEYGATITVRRYSGKGFAIGSETACGGAQYLWGAVGGKWRVVWFGQEGPYCASLTKLQRRGLTAIGGSCIDPNDQTVNLGHWPTAS